ncbi:hypothetical protein MTR67_043146 [Solanum verrucosum]|uniref:Uncharacterized protein n=1 Tax=Solanum verrucosum TaxID=315347 RepID=A0AAF0UQT4_SOLVR|nr:hypothetical protein MTR67_043146 [Solanum verrucosum]
MKLKLAVLFEVRKVLVVAVMQEVILRNNI